MSAYREAPALPCPRCNVVLEPTGSAQGCRACRGVWLDEAVLADMLTRMKGEPAHLSFWSRAAIEPPPCPGCQRPLAAVWLENAPLDRCTAGHGVWFDADELETVLRHAGTSPPRRGEPPAPRESRGGLDVINALLDLFTIFR